MHTGYTLVVVLIYAAGMMAFSVAFLVDWIRNFRRIHGYWRQAVVTGFILVVLNAMAIVGSPGEWSPMRAIAIVSLPVLFVRVVGFAMLGMHYCIQMGYPSFLLLPPEPLTEDAALTDAPSPTAEDVGPRIGSVGPDLPPAVVEALVEPIPQVGSPAAEAVENSPPGEWSLRGYLRDVLIVAVVSVAYTVLLFLLARPHPTEIVERFFGVRRDAADDGVFTPLAVLVVLLFAFAEEVFFRLGIQNFLAHYLRWQGNRYWAAIALTSLLWTLGHAGVLDPGWVKFTQVFPMGLMLGWLFRRHGVEACMLAHGVFNVIGMGLSSILLT